DRRLRHSLCDCGPQTLWAACFRAGRVSNRRVEKSNSRTVHSSTCQLLDSWTPRLLDVSTLRLPSTLRGRRELTGHRGRCRLPCLLLWVGFQPSQGVSCSSNGPRSEDGGMNHGNHCI